MSSMKNPTAQRGLASTASKRRFMIRMVTVLIGGMFLDGYVLGILGPVSGTMAEDLQLNVFGRVLIAAAALSAS
jgi:putative MFS transporter